MANPGEMAIVCFGSEPHHHMKINKEMYGSFCDGKCSKVGTLKSTGDSPKDSPTASFALVSFCNENLTHF